VARKSVLAGIAAGRKQMEIIRSELLAARRWVEEHQSPDALASDDAGSVGAEISGTESPSAVRSVPAESLSQEAKMNLKTLQVRAREYRHHLNSFKHQVELHEAKRPRQEDEIVSLKAELSNTLEVFASTQHAVKHHEVERDFQSSVQGPPMDPDSPDNQKFAVALHGGGHGTTEALLERHIRERAEGRNVRLSGKAKRLGGVVASQDLLIQRLEKQVLNEEHMLEQKDRELMYGAQDISVLKKMVRTCSDSATANLLGFSPMSQRSASLPQLPAI